MRILLFFLALTLISSTCSEGGDYSIDSANAFVYSGDEDFPKPYAWVNDYVGILTEVEALKLNQKIDQYEKETSNQIALVFMNTLPFVKKGDSNKFMTVGEYTTALGQKWGVGQKDKDNGLVILSLIEDREMWIATGLGTEKTISDADCQKVIDEIFVPFYQKSKHYKACDKGLDEIFEMWQD